MLNHILRLQCDTTLWSVVQNKITMFFHDRANGQICDNSYPFQSTYSRSTVSYAFLTLKQYRYMLVHMYRLNMIVRDVCIIAMAYFNLSILMLIFLVNELCV